MSRTTLRSCRPVAGLLGTALLGALMMAPACDKSRSVDPTPGTSTAASPAATPPATSAGVTPAKDVVVEDVGPPAPSIIMIGGMKGYLEPCGCTLDVKAGGIDKVAGFIEKVRGFAPAHLTLASGNIWFESPTLDEPEIAQARLKAQTLAKVFKHLGIEVVSVGPTDFALGVEEYRALAAQAGVKPYGLNVKVGGEALPGTYISELGGVKAGVIVASEPELFEGIKGVEAAALEPLMPVALKELEDASVDVVVLMYQGKLAGAKKLAAAYPRVDFVLVGEEPRETDQVDDAGARGKTLEVFDQGRYIGVLKLYDPKGGERDEVFANARTGSKAELEAVDRQIEHVNKSINRLPPAAPGEEPPMLAGLRERLRTLQERKLAMKSQAIELPEGSRAFIWRTTRLDEGYPVDAKMLALQQEVNAEIDRVNRATEFEVVPVKEGEAFYVGNAQCKTCHAEAFAFWETTNHAHALKTLQDVKKDFNQDCIGCHVVGYEKPGGSVLGKLSYEVELAGGVTVAKDLANVGCENCHGPASKHVEAALFGKHGKPSNFIVNLGINEQTCMQSCHVEEHSPRFNYEVYREQIIGKGHGGS